MPYFQEWLKVLENMGYKNYWQILNAKDFGVPQNRERVFCVSILGDHEPYEFPQPKQLNIRLKDVLEKQVDDKYYLSEKVQQRFKYNPKGQLIIGTTAPETISIGQRYIVYNTENTIGALVATDYKQPKQIIDFVLPNGKMAEIKDEITEPTCFKEVRTEAGKQARREARQKGLGDTTPRNKDTKMFVPNQNGLSNCLMTTPNVDSLIIEPNDSYRFYKQAFETLEQNNCKDGDTIDAFNKKVNSSGICPTITTRPEGFKTAILNIVKNDEPIIVASRGRYTDKDDPTKTEQQLELNDSCLSNTITTVQKDNYVTEPKIINLSIDAKHQQDLIQHQDGLCRTIPAGTHASTPHLLKTVVSDNPFRIRKLTPKECWRLMGWKDEQIDKVKGISNSQLYKQAGNSIVVNVLEEIFRKLFLNE